MKEILNKIISPHLPIKFLTDSFPFFFLYLQTLQNIRNNVYKQSYNYRIMNPFTIYINMKGNR